MGSGCPLAGHSGQGDAQQAAMVNEVGGLPHAPVGGRRSEEMQFLPR